jgi:hypothetical protein
MLVKPKNWGDFQHYKDRDPPWIKLHKKLLDDYEFQSLPVASRALAPMLWLLASEHKDGVIDAENRKLCFRLRMKPAEMEDAIRPLIAAGFFELLHDASSVLAQRKRDAMPEAEAETQEKAEVEAEAVADAPGQNKSRRERKVQSSLPDDCPTEADRNAAARHWRDRGRGDLCASLGDQVEAFRAHHIAHGKRMADWGAAWRTWYGNAIRFQAKPKPAAGNASTVPRPVYDDTHEDRWRERFRTFQVRGSWSSNWGPKPGEEGCRCPPQILGGDA